MTSASGGVLGVAEVLAGSFVYSRDGQKHYVREVLPNARLLASPMLVVDGYDGEEEYPADTANIKIASEMSVKPPVEVVDAEVAKARSDLSDIRSAIAAARVEASQAERDANVTLAKLAKAPKFERLLDFVEGKITHFVVSDYQAAAEIKTWAEFAIYREDGRDKGVKLLTLFGRSDGNTEWKLNQYYDGSGSSTVCQPCTSEEEAHRVVGEWIEAAWLTFNADRPWFTDGAIKSADKYGFPVPAHIREASVAHVLAARQRNVDKLEADLETARAALRSAAEAAREKQS